MVVFIQRRGREMPTKPAKRGAHLELGTVLKKKKSHAWLYFYE